jgi:hypothetical protein
MEIQDPRTTAMKNIQLRPTPDTASHENILKLFLNFMLLEVLVHIMKMNIDSLTTTKLVEVCTSILFIRYQKVSLEHDLLHRLLLRTLKSVLMDTEATGRDIQSQDDNPAHCHETMYQPTEKLSRPFKSKTASFVLFMSNPYLHLIHLHPHLLHLNQIVVSSHLLSKDPSSKISNEPMSRIKSRIEYSSLHGYLHDMSVPLLLYPYLLLYKRYSKRKLPRLPQTEIVNRKDVFPPKKKAQACLSESDKLEKEHMAKCIRHEMHLQASLLR